MTLSTSKEVQLSQNPKSDVAAKVAFRDELVRRGFDNVRITRAPADITGKKGGQMYYFEIKFTQQGARYFGAATLAEWEAARKYEDRFYFVVAFLRGGSWTFHEYAPSEFMQMSYIPPFKIFFNVRVSGEKSVSSRHGSGAVSLTPKRLINDERAILSIPCR